jgi:hypothetical protein
MQSIKFAAGSSDKPSFFAGLYLRTPRRTRFWGWGDPPVRAAAGTSSAAPAGNPPWAGVGEWLRAAHAFFGSDRPEHAPIAADAPTFSATSLRPTELHSGRNASGKRRRLRFVCNRHVIGFVID